MKSVDICVVGAGPGGALLSLLLAKKGYSVALVERTATVAKAFRGEHVNEEGEAILKKHGLYEKIEQLGLLKMEQLQYWQDGQCCKTIYPDPAVGHLGIHVPQAHLLQVILDEAMSYKNFELMLETKVCELLQNEYGVYCGVEVACKGERQIINAKLVIGADGRYSTVRKKANIDMQIRKHGYDLLWARIPQPKDWEPSIKMACVEGHQISIFTQAKGYIQIGWNITEKSFPTIRKGSFEPFINKLIKAFPQMRDTVQKYITSWDDFVLLDVFSSITEQWGDPGLVLIGDAVHAMTPTGAFGLNSALKDADILATLLKNETIQHIHLLNCATERKKEVARIQAMQIEKEQGFTSQFAMLV